MIWKMTTSVNGHSEFDIILLNRHVDRSTIHNHDYSFPYMEVTSDDDDDDDFVYLFISIGLWGRISERRHDMTGAY